MRLEFNKATKLQAWRRACGHCERCGQAFGERRPTYDHKLPAAMGGGNELGNCWVLCPKCDREKTSIEDMPVIWKSNRIRDKRAGLRKPRRRFIDRARDK